MIRFECAWDLLLLAALHLLLLSAGGATVYLRVRFSSSDWPQVARAAYAGDVAELEVAMAVVGCAMLAVAVVGAVAAYLRKKTLLLAEALLLLLVMGGTVFLAVRTLVMYGRASQWQSRGWDAASASKSSGERRAADSFDALYCDAQLAFVCDHATVQQLLALGPGNLALLSGGDNASLNGSTCALSSGSTTGDWDELCAVCSGVTWSYASVSSLSHWVEDNCAYSGESAQWCSERTSPSLSSLNGVSGIDGSGAAAAGEDALRASPYAHCRAPMLAQAVRWSAALGVAWSGVCALLLLLLLCVVLLIRMRANADALDLEEAAASFQDDDRSELQQGQTMEAEETKKASRETAASTRHGQRNARLGEV